MPKPKMQVNMTVYCLPERRHYKVSELKNAKMVTSGKRYRIVGMTPSGYTVSRFISKNEAQGSGLIGQALGMPGGKIPILGDIPLLGMLF